MNISNNILKHYLKNVYFITGTAYAGKSTTVKMLSEKYDMIFCGENYHSEVSNVVANPENQPEISYLNNLTDFRDFVTRSPEEYARWIFATSKEAAEFEIAELLSISKDKKVIVDTNIPIDILKEISKKYGIVITPDKEMVLILVSNKITDQVVEAIYKNAGLTTDGQGIVFTLPVDNVAGLKLE